MDSSTATGKQSALDLSPLEDKSGGIFDHWNVPWKHNKRHNINIWSANIPLTEASSFHNQSRELSNSLGKPTLLLIILIFYFYLKISAQPKLHTEMEYDRVTGFICQERRRCIAQTHLNTDGRIVTRDRTGAKLPEGTMQTRLSCFTPQGEQKMAAQQTLHW